VTGAFSPCPLDEALGSGDFLRQPNPPTNRVRSRSHLVPDVPKCLVQKHFVWRVADARRLPSHFIENGSEAPERGRREGRPRPKFVAGMKGVRAVETAAELLFLYFGKFPIHLSAVLLLLSSKLMGRPTQCCFGTRGMEVGVAGRGRFPAAAAASRIASYAFWSYRDEIIVSASSSSEHHDQAL